jgi:TonB family protein
LLRGPSPPASADNLRRRSLIGAERDVGLRMYVESWRSKIERNGTLNYRRSAGMRAPDNPIVTVSIRSDGSLEDIVIHRSSGLRELDEAVRRIAQLHAPYSAFPPELARQFDVIDIRRVWFFDNTLRIMDEM